MCFVTINNFWNPLLISTSLNGMTRKGLGSVFSFIGKGEGSGKKGGRGDYRGTRGVERGVKRGVEREEQRHGRRHDTKLSTGVFIPLDQ